MGRRVKGLLVAAVDLLLGLFLAVLFLVTVAVLAQLFGWPAVGLAGVTFCLGGVVLASWEHWRDGGTRSWADYASALNEDIDDLRAEHGCVLAERDALSVRLGRSTAEVGDLQAAMGHMMGRLARRDREAAGR